MDLALRRLTSSQVKQLQRALNHETETFPTLRVDGRIGPKTQQALTDAFDTGATERLRQRLTSALGQRAPDLIPPSSNKEG